MNTQLPHIGTIITDCKDDNARARQELRFASLFGFAPTFLGVGKHAPDIEAGGNMIDQLHALSHVPYSAGGAQSLMLVNVAPRGAKVRKRWNNGTPFCYVRVGNVLIVSTYAGRTLAFLKKFGLADSVEVMDIPTVVAAAVEWGGLTPEHADRITHTQFRSFEFLPLAAYWLAQGRDVPSETYPIEGEEEITNVAWHIDNFGNVKTTLLPEEVNFADGREITLADGKIATCYTRLADVPTDTSALVIGSSGFGNKRFLESVVQWKDRGFNGSNSGADRHGFIVGGSIMRG